MPAVTMRVPVKNAILFLKSAERCLYWFRTTQCSEARMEKQQSRSPAKPLPAIPNAVYGRIESRPRERARGPGKPSRDEIARCINIWAAVYRLRDDDSADFDTSELTMPSRTWAGRIPPSIERFE